MKLACIAIVLTTASARADDTTLRAPAPQRTFGIDGVAILPLGNYADAALFGAGALGRIELPLAATGGFVTGRLGVIAHQVNDNSGMTSLTFVPVFAGYRQPVGTGGVYLAGELGITFGYGSADTRFGQVSASDSELGFTLTAGVRRGALDLRAGLFSPDTDDVHGFMGSLGYDFAAF